MAHKLIVVVDAMVLGPQYQGKRYATVMLSAGIEPDGINPITDQTVEDCKPWTWDAIAGFHLADKSTGQWGVIDAIAPAPVPSRSPALASLGPRLDGHVTWLRQQPPTDDRALLDIARQMTGADNSPWLPAFLADVSRWPAPLARIANCAFVVPLPNGLDLTKAFILVPVVKVRGQELTLQGQPDETGGDLKWEAIPDAAFRTQPVVVPVSDAAVDLVDMTTQWIHASDRTSEHGWYGNDIWSGFPKKLAVVADPLRVLTYIATNALKAQDDLGKWLDLEAGRAWLLNGLKAAIRKSFFATVKRADDEQSLVSFVVLMTNAANNASLTAFVAAVGGYENAGDILVPLGKVLAPSAFKSLSSTATLPPPASDVAAAAAEMQKFKANSAVLTELLFALWDVATASDPVAQAYLTELRKMSAKISELDIAARHEAAAIKGYVGRLLPINLWVSGARADFNAKLRAVLVNNMPALPGGLPQVQAALDIWLDLFVENARLLPDAPLATPQDWRAEIGDDTPTSAAHALAFPVGPVTPSTAGPAATADLHRRLAGYAVLLRPAKANAPLDNPNPNTDFDAWRSLHMANIRVAPQSWNGSEAAFEADTTATLVLGDAVPSKLAFAAGVSNPFVVYDNAGIIAAESQQQQQGSYGATGDGQHRTTLRFKAARNGGGNLIEWAKTPYLRFGQVYERAAFAVANGGALPAELALGGDPASLKALPSDVTDPIPGPAIGRMRYLRRVRVSEPRLEGTIPGKGRSKVLQTSPPTLRPEALRTVAQELEVFGRPAGLDAQHPTVLYFADAAGTKGQLQLAQRNVAAAPETASFVGLRLLAVDTANLGTGKLVVRFVQPRTNGASLPLYSIEITRSGGVVTANLGGANPGLAARITLASSNALVDLQINPVTRAKDWLMVLRQTGRPFDHIDQTHTGSLASSRVLAVPNGLDTWRDAAIQIELTGTGSARFGRPAVRVGTAWMESDSSTPPPIVLLPFADGKVDAHLRLPTVDAELWSRWVAMDELRVTDDPSPRARYAATYPHRIEAILDSEEIAATNAESDASFDDPAVEPAFLFELVPLMSPGDGGVITRHVTLNLNTTGSDLERVRCETLSLAIKSGPAAITSSLEISIPFGEVWELRIYSLVNSAWFYPKSGTLPAGLKARFPDLVRDGLPTYQYNANSYVLTAPTRIRVEVPKKMPPMADALAALVVAQFKVDMLRVDWGLSAYEDSITALPQRNALWAARFDLANVGMARVYHQQWRWDGVLPPPDDGDPRWPLRESRVDFGFPFAAAAQQPTWVERAFAGRDANDYAQSAVTQTALPFATTNIFQRGMSGDPRASAHRFTVQVQDRYAALYQPGEDAWQWATIQGSGGHVPFDNRAVVVPCRWADNVPKPSIKFAIPLTQSATPDGMTNRPGEPGLLVVLNEPWGEVGGLAEAFEWRVEVAVRQDDTVNQTLLEAGPDPIIDDKSFAGTTQDILQGKTYELRFAGRGPMGHTFDRQNSALRAVASTSIVLEPQVFLDGQPADADNRLRLPWSFAKLAFRRTLLPGAMAGSADRPEASIASPWTTADWHQMLPDSSHYVVVDSGTAATKERVNVATELVLNLAGGKISFTRQGNPAVPRPAVSRGYNRFGLIAVLTERIYDAAGRRRFERFRGLFEARGNDFEPLEPVDITQLDPAAAQVRLVEVQFRAPELPPPTETPRVSDLISGGQSFWDLLFHETLADDKRARIVRVSEPITRTAAGVGP